MNAPFSNLAPDALQAVAFTFALRLATVRLARIIFARLLLKAARALSDLAARLAGW